MFGARTNFETPLNCFEKVFSPSRVSPLSVLLKGEGGGPFGGGGGELARRPTPSRSTLRIVTTATALSPVSLHETPENNQKHAQNRSVLKALCEGP